MTEDCTFPPSGRERLAEIRQRIEAKAPSYANCPHVLVGNQVSCTVTNCTICDDVYRSDVATMPWYSRLDEWHHQRGHDSQLWFWLWRPFCNIVDWKYRR